MRYPWLMWVNAILGVWLILAPFVLGFSTNTYAMISNVVAGALVTIIGVVAAVVEPGRTSAPAQG